MESIFINLKQMGIFLVLGGLLHYLVPSPEYGRYIRLLMITVLMALITTPVLEIFSPEGFERFCIQSEAYYNEILKNTYQDGAEADSFTNQLKERVEQEWLEWGSSYLQEKQESAEG